MIEYIVAALVISGVGLMVARNMDEGMARAGAARVYGGCIDLP